MKQFPTNWKKSYWPEPRLGRTKLTRGEAIRNNRAAIKAREAEARASRVSAALAAD